MYIPLSPLYRSARQKLNREVRELTDVMTQNMKKYTLFSAPQETLTKTDHIVGNKANLNRLKNGIAPCILLDHHVLKLEFNYDTNFRKTTSSWKINNVRLTHQLIKEEIKKSKTSYNSAKMITQHTQSYGTQ